MYCCGRLADDDDDDDEDNDAEEASGTPIEDEIPDDGEVEERNDEGDGDEEEDEEEGVELTYPVALWNERNAARSNAGEVGSYI